MIMADDSAESAEIPMLIEMPSNDWMMMNR